VSTSRYAALLAVLLAIGLAGVAEGASGDPLILGGNNTSDQPTNLNGQFSATTMSAVAFTTMRLALQSSRIIRFTAGESVRSIDTSSGLVPRTGNAALLTRRSA